jgi:hypothetical protein
MQNVATATKGLSILASRPKTTVEIENERMQSEVERLTRATRTLAEVLQLKKGDMRAPSRTFDELKRCISMFTLLNLVCGEINLILQ